MLLDESIAKLNFYAIYITSLSGYEKVLVGYDMPELSKYYDFFNLMGYDFHGAWEK